MATRPQSEYSPERSPEPDRQDGFAGAFEGQQRLSTDELKALLAFFSLLDEWDRKTKIV
jgi:hypothetical protein